MPRRNSNVCVQCPTCGRKVRITPQRTLKGHRCGRPLTPEERKAVRR